MKKPTHKKILSSPPMQKFKLFFSTLRFLNYLFFYRTVLNQTDTTSNVNPFGHSVCKLNTTHLRADSNPPNPYSPF